MTFEVLISTMNQKNDSILEKMNIDSDAVVINQCDIERRREFDYRGNHITWIDSKQRGLSRSRNLALKNSVADICLLADDDLVFQTGYKQRIIYAFKTHKEEMIRFRVSGIECKFKQYPNCEQKIGYIKSLKVSSVEIAFRRKNIVKSGIKFDEKLGAGTEFCMGEENAFLFQCFRKGLHMRFLPVEIANLHIGNSTWFVGFNRNYFISRGAMFAGMTKIFSHLLIFQFAIRKYTLYKKEISFFRAIKCMEYGRKKYLTDA